MAPAARQSRHVLIGGATAVMLAALVFVSACGSSPEHVDTSTTPPVSVSPSPSARSVMPFPTALPTHTATPGAEGTYGTGYQPMTFTEPAHTGVNGKHLGSRSLPTQIWYPVARGSSGPQAAPGPFPLLMFAPGFAQCVSQYQHLLQTWATAGYVVAAVTFPRSNCSEIATDYEPDIVNQPADVSYVLSSLLALNAKPGNLFSGLLNPDEIAAAGQSDGGDTVAAMATNPCCRDNRLKAVAVLSGAEWPFLPWKYSPSGEPPMLFTQGSADTVNLPSTSVQLYRGDKGGPRYYLALFGATHLVPYEGNDSEERLVARICLEFFARYVLGDAGALATMMREGNASGAAALDTGGTVPAGAG